MRSRCVVGSAAKKRIDQCLKMHWDGKLNVCSGQIAVAGCNEFAVAWLPNLQRKMINASARVILSLCFPN